MRLRDGAVVTVVVLLAGSAIDAGAPGPPPVLGLNDNGSFEGRGPDVLVFYNWYSGEFSDWHPAPRLAVGASGRGLFCG